jgi:hypothetical protein
MAEITGWGIPETTPDTDPFQFIVLLLVPMKHLFYKAHGFCFKSALGSIQR